MIMKNSGGGQSKRDVSRCDQGWMGWMMIARGVGEGECERGEKKELNIVIPAVLAVIR